MCGFTIEDLNMSGTMPAEKESFIILVKYGNNFPVQSLRRLVGIGSRVQDLDGESKIHFNISSLSTGWNSEKIVPEKVLKWGFGQWVQESNFNLILSIFSLKKFENLSHSSKLSPTGNTDSEFTPSNLFDSVNSSLHDDTDENLSL